MLLEPSLLNAPAAFFQVHSAILCPSTRSTTGDADILGMVDSFQHLEFSASIQSWDDAVAKSGAGNGKLMIICEQGCQSDLISKIGLEPDKFWVSILDHNVPPPLAPLDLRLDSNWFTIDTDFTLLDHYRVKGGPLISNIIGSWSGERGLEFEEPFVWSRRSNLGGASLTSTALPYDPMLIIDNAGDDSEDEYSGYMADILESLQGELNFSIVSTSPVDRDWGVIRTNDSGYSYWSGMVGQLSRGEADISPAGLTIRSDRQTVIDYSVGVADEEFTLVIKGGQKSRAIDIMTFLVAFVPISWMVFTLTALASAAVFTLVRLPGKEQKVLKLYLKGLVALIKTLLQLDSGEDGDQWSYRTLFMAAWFLCFFVFQGYTANITATMTAGSDVVPIRSFQDVLDEGYKVAVGEGTAMEAFFNSAPDDSPTGKVRDSRLKVNPYNWDPGYSDKMIQYINSNYLVSIYEPVFAYANRKEVKVLHEFREKMTSYVGFGLQKDSELKSVFDYHLIRLRESGFMSKIKKKWIGNDLPEDMTHRIYVKEPLVLGFDNLFFPSTVILIGIIGASVLSICEKCAVPRKMIVKRY